MKTAYFKLDKDQLKAFLKLKDGISVSNLFLRDNEARVYIDGDELPDTPAGKPFPKIEYEAVKGAE